MLLCSLLIDLVESDYYYQGEAKVQIKGAFQDSLCDSKGLCHITDVIDYLITAIVKN